MQRKPNTDKLYDLKWGVNNRVVEVIMTAKPIGLVKWKKRVCKNTTHTTGQLIIVETNA